MTASLNCDICGWHNWSVENEHANREMCFRSVATQRDDPEKALRECYERGYKTLRSQHDLAVKTAEDALLTEMGKEKGDYGLCALVGMLVDDRKDDRSEKGLLIMALKKWVLTCQKCRGTGRIMGFMISDHLAVPQRVDQGPCPNCGVAVIALGSIGETTP